MTVLDGPSFALDDPGAVRRAAVRARRTGCDGCWVVHPSQVEPVHAAFAPTDDEVEQARVVLELVTDDAAVVRLGGRMLDTASLRRARSVLARAGR
jgi:citrate lyase subunit beta/citryl-CoA lyase